MSLIAYISFAWMYSAFWCERKEDNNINDDDERGFLREKKKKRDQNHNTNTNSNTNLPGSPGLPLAAADVRNPREEETVVVVLLLANRRTIAVTAAADIFYRVVFFLRDEIMKRNFISKIFLSLFFSLINFCTKKQREEEETIMGHSS